jgi:hypothetical protein
LPSTIVSCVRPPGEARHVCFTSDYRIVVLDRFVRSRAKPPKPPANVCRMPDVFADAADPERLAERIGVPCRLTVPCVVYRHVKGREVAEPSVNEELCEELCFEYPPREGISCDFSWHVLEDLMDIIRHHTAFGHLVFRSAVFIGRNKAYPAPWGPTRLVYETMKTLIALGYLPKEFELEILKKFNATEVYHIIAYERYGRIHTMGFNFYPKPDGKYEAIAVFWVGSDWSARKYALTLWDMHKEYTRKVIEFMESAPDYVRARVELYRNLYVAGKAVTASFWPVRGYPSKDVGKLLQKIASEPPIRLRPLPGMDEVADRMTFLFHIVERFIGGADGVEDEEQAN